ncbi:MAG TPA: phosphoribosylglycinamide formyltransferase [Gammaproteobacteria bacterium]|nr:phosphoribosylglycinamide formyltransferase [Gammaproteobacteria bacterium]
MKTLHLAILGSTKGTDLLALIEAIQQKRLRASIKLVISDQAQALILQKAQAQGLISLFIDPQGKSREMFDRELSRILEEAKIDLIVLIGFMRILSTFFVTRWKNKIINVHPSLLPAFAGYQDQNVHQAVLNAGVKESGCTVHQVTEQVDQGPILVQKKCAILRGDTVETLKARVQILEGVALIEAIHSLNTPRLEETHES